VLSAAGGFLGVPAIFGMPHLFSHFLEPLLSFRHHAAHPSETFEYTLIGVSIAALIVIILAVRNYYITKKTVPEREDEKLGPLSALVYNKYYVDEIYAALITKPLDRLSSFSYKYVENGFIDRIVNGTGTTLNKVSSLLKEIQTGNIGFYIFIMILGIIALLALNLIL
jgi:NADH-quinone oxidoreductase subunit L